MEPLVHLPLEPYKSRYTELLADWELKAFSKEFSVTQVKPSSSVAIDVMAGRVLDEIGRPCYAMEQILHVLRGSKSRQIGKMYLSDFYTPGLDALAYSGKRFQASAFCWAQTFDLYDFTYEKHLNWMRLWEFMALNLYKHVFVASSMLKELICSACASQEIASKIHVVGLPFSSEGVNATCNISLAPAEEIDVVYSSRWDLEKDPRFFLNVVESNPDLKFAVCTGHPDLVGTDDASVKHALRLEAAGKLRIFRGLAKARYYAILARSKVQFNCALQDWVSFTLLEALTMGCSPLYPNHRSFPEALMYSEPNLYMPNNLDDACYKLRSLVSKDSAFKHREAILMQHDNTLANITRIIKDND